MTIVAGSEDGLAGRENARQGRVWRRCGVFVLAGLLLYLALYAWAEYLVYAHGERNRFFMIRAAPPQHFDFVILGASHAMPLGFEDMNERLEAATGSGVINLSAEGSGVLPNQLMLQYLLTRHTAGHVIFVIDSFAFYSAEWNEDRLDAAMLQRAPLDPALAVTLWRHPWARDVLPAYLSGFAKINNEDRFAPDISDSEMNKFNRTYRRIAQIDRQRLQYLYPSEPDPAVFRHYLGAFESLIRFVQDRGMEMIVVKPPTPPRYRQNLPNEAAFDEAVGALTARLGVAYQDLSEAVTEDPFFYDTDHLNRDGVVTFIDEHFAELLRAQL